MRKDNCIIYRGAMWMYYPILLTKIPENVQQLEGETTNQILLVTGLMKGKKGILHQRPRQQLASHYPFFFFLVMVVVGKVLSTPLTLNYT